MPEINSKIIASGSYLPKKILTNDELAKTVDTSDEWIFSRSGISQRHIAAEGEYTSDLGYQAAVKALENCPIDKEQIDVIIVATSTPDNIFPSTATKIQHKLGLKNCYAFDLQAVCSGFVYGLVVANGLIKSGSAQNILLIGAETLSRIVDWQDRGSCVLFGDGAGAVVLSANKKDDSGIISHALFSDGEYYDILKTNGGPSMTGGEGKITMEGKEVFKHAVGKMSESVVIALKKAGLELEDVNLLIPHQANQRIISAVGKKLGLSNDKVVSTVKNHANTSAASIPLALDYACKNNLISNNDIIVFEALGAGLTWGTVIYKW
ncbi:MAG: ketoacyl-ACP synthase III [Rickettsiales bacterium]|jgi:3-oxoacyl-[acyl-carrier-protein] synthase III|nr:ketoacyl-ACP synthase III [Rickettsiales bacterium]